MFSSTPTFVLLLVSTLLSHAVNADDNNNAQFPLQPTHPIAPSPLLSGNNGYAYIGCWNETTGFAEHGGVRALSAGRNAAHDAMTVQMCLEFCAGWAAGSSAGDKRRPMQYAGLEAGRECYCSNTLSALSTLLNEQPTTRCTRSCAGDSKETCGGGRALSLYNLTSEAAAAADAAEESQTGIAWSQFAGAPAWYGMLAAITLVIAAIM